MLNIPRLTVITKDTKESTIGLDRIISEKKILKTKLKLIHISLLDKDLQTLNAEGLGIDSLKLEDFRLTETSNLVVPVYNRMTPNKTFNTLESYLIYLSYLYNIDLQTLYQENFSLFYRIIINIELPPEIKMNLFELIKYSQGAYFSENLETLNSAEYREKINQDEKRLRRLIVK